MEVSEESGDPWSSICMCIMRRQFFSAGDEPIAIGITEVRLRNIGSSPQIKAESAILAQTFLVAIHMNNFLLFFYFLFFLKKDVQIRRRPIALGAALI